MSFTTGTGAYSRHVGRYGPALASAFCAAAGVRAGDAALDVGCGPGPLLAELARRLGPARVAGVDPSAPFVEACRDAVPGVEVRLGTAEELPFGDGAFEVVLSQLVVNFLADATRAVGEMRRVARRTVAACVWDYAGGMTMLRAFWDAALELDPGAPDEGAVMRYCSPDELRALWDAGGLGSVATGALEVTADYAGFDDYWSPFTTGLAPSGAYCASLGDEAREALRAACFRRLGSPAGPFRLGARAFFVRGEV
ncbi:MAG TPA: methyltransferase domain-containing protein [Gaiellaceae bacterium]|nr:methyltransferase domain-containing protein [Gaiellaceae bacterium]